MKGNYLPPFPPRPILLSTLIRSWMEVKGVKKNSCKTKLPNHYYSILKSKGYTKPYFHFPFGICKWEVAVNSARPCSYQSRGA